MWVVVGWKFVRCKQYKKSAGWERSCLTWPMLSIMQSSLSTEPGQQPGQILICSAPCWAISAIWLRGRNYPGGSRVGRGEEQWRGLMTNTIVCCHSAAPLVPSSGPGHTISLLLTPHLQHSQHHQEVKLSLKVNQPGRLNQFCHRTGRSLWVAAGREGSQ